MEIPRDGDYEEFRTFPDRGPAEALCSWLEFEGVPSYIESRALSSGVETTFVVFVLKKLAHRARWIVAHRATQSSIFWQQVSYLGSWRISSAV